MIAAMIVGFIFRYAYWGVNRKKHKYIAMAIGCLLYFGANWPLILLYYADNDPFPFYFFSIFLPLLFAAGYYSKKKVYLVIVASILPGLFILGYMHMDTVEKRVKRVTRNVSYDKKAPVGKPAKSDDGEKSGDSTE